MARFVFCFCICLTVVALNGCIVIDTPSSGGKDSGAAHNSAPPTQAQPDNRTVGDLRRENSLLRPQLAKLEEQ